jgi:hypothetical protein
MPPSYVGAGRDTQKFEMRWQCIPEAKQSANGDRLTHRKSQARLESCHPSRRVSHPGGRSSEGRHSLAAGPLDQLREAVSGFALRPNRHWSAPQCDTSPHLIVLGFKTAAL